METGLDVARVKDHFVAQSKRAANIAARAGLAHIQKHAPVRKLFRGTSFRMSGELSVNRRLASNFAKPNSAGFTGTHRSGRIARQFRFQQAEDVGVRTGKLQLEEAEQEHRQRIGHANSEVPVFRFKSKRFNTLVSGDFRQVRNGELVAASPSVVRQRGNRFIDVPNAGPPVTARGLKGPDGKRILTARGEFEVKSGRATFKSPDGVQRIGGRLKGELRVIEAVYRGNHVWAYVESPTVDPETGYPYPRAQEFGSAHNRPHPFMRPGLHETRNELVNATKQAVRAGSQQ